MAATQPELCRRRPSCNSGHVNWAANELDASIETLITFLAKSQAWALKLKSILVNSFSNYPATLPKNTRNPLSTGRTWKKMSAMSANQGTMISLNREPGPRAGNRLPIKGPRCRIESPRGLKWLVGARTRMPLVWELNPALGPLL